MTSKRKKEEDTEPPVPVQDTSDNSSNSDSDSDTENQNEEFEIEFEFDAPQQYDFHGFKNFLKEYSFPNNKFASEIVDKIISQTDITTVIRVADNDELFGFISVLNFHENSNLQGMQEIQDYILSKAGDKRETLKQIFADSSTPLGLIFSERMPNVPPELAFPLNRALFENIKEVVAIDKAEKKEKSPFNFENYIIVTHYLQSANYNEATIQKEGKNKAKKSKVVPQQKEEEEPQVIYPKLEDEIFQQEAVLSFTFDISRNELPSQWTLMGEMAIVGLVAVIGKKKIPGILKQLDSS